MCIAHCQALLFLTKCYPHVNEYLVGTPNPNGLGVLLHWYTYTTAAKETTANARDLQLFLPFT